MKKFIAMLLTAASALSLCLFAACGEEDENSKASDVVTKNEWMSAMVSSNFLNVTVDAKHTYSDTDSDGVVDTSESSGVSKSAFKLNSSADCITGNGYSYSEGSDSDGYSGTTTYYESFTDSSYYYVAKYTEEGEDDQWYGHRYSSAGTLDDSVASVYGYITNIIDEFSNFEYVDGMYKYVDSYDIVDSWGYESMEYTYCIKINDGRVTYFMVDDNDYFINKDYSYSSSSI
ncbi:MAG: hypothetical protein LUF82_01290, partial [Clostridia bacterium]|nr:hypothetical protein [Clostridia bacterium]